ncbi:MAG: hypothetical protein QM715_15540 [Nibricoccus sp.]
MPDALADGMRGLSLFKTKLTVVMNRFQRANKIGAIRRRIADLEKAKTMRCERLLLTPSSCLNAEIWESTEKQAITALTGEISRLNGALMLLEGQGELVLT